MTKKADIKIYKSKRVACKTPEPFSSTTNINLKHPIFVIQEHAATHLHYDIRFESDGVLKSWALPKGPPLLETEKHLAIPTEDHPISYATFEGEIPEGNYGAGTVMVWDLGTFVNITKDKNGQIMPISKCIKNGRLKVNIDGKKLHGKYVFLKTKLTNKAYWLFFKMKGGEKFAIKNKNLSVLSGRTMQQIKADNNKKSSKKNNKSSNNCCDTCSEDSDGDGDPFAVLPNKIISKLKETKIPKFIEPMLPSLYTKLPVGSSWLYERKYDGQRCICFKKGKVVKLFSRNKKILNNNYPEIVEVIKCQKADSFIVDGEIVAFNGDKTDFGKLQERMFVTDFNKSNKSSIEVTYCIFDILYLNNFNLFLVPLKYRKKLLAKAICFTKNKNLNYVNFVENNGQAFFDHAKKSGWEGIVAKNCLSSYQQKRSKDWLKLKCLKDLDLIIGGYTEPSGKRKGLGALLLGYYDSNSKLCYKLCYIGKVGTGFSNKMLKILESKLKPLRQKNSPFINCDVPIKNIHWVKPNMVATVKYREFTKTGKLWHPSFIGLRIDKNASDIKMDSGELSMNFKKNNIIKVNKHDITLSHEEKIMFPKVEITKKDVIDYYLKIAPWMLPHVKNRFVTMFRLPIGVNGESFYQKEVPESYPKWICRILVPKIEGGDRCMAVINNAATLVYLANQDCITPHISLSRIDKLKVPDRMIFDFDPSDGAEFNTICKTVLQLKKLLEYIGLVPYVMTTGSRGLHIIVPIVRNVDFDTVRDLAHKIANKLISLNPENLTNEARKNKRLGRIYIDISRNAYGQTSVAPYAIRAKAVASVATPLKWEELLNKELNSQMYTVKNIFNRLNKYGDPWEDISSKARSIKKAQKKFQNLVDKSWQ